MTNGSWDNSGGPAPQKSGLPLWGKIAIGCGIVFLLALGTCVAGGAYFVHKAQKDPEGVKRWAMGFAMDKIRPDWEDLRAVVEQLRTEQGCKDLYAANPGLANTWATEASFLEASKAWRKDLQPLPELSPDLLGHGGFNINHALGGKVHVAWRPKQGPDITVTFEGPHRPGGAPRRIAELKVR